MKKQWKAIMSLALMLVLLISMSVGVMADDGTNIPGYNTTGNGTTDMNKFTFAKVFELVGDVDNGDFPNETFTIHFNRHKVSGLPTTTSTTKDNMPAIPDAEITSASIQAAGKTELNGKWFKKMTVDVTLPTYTEIGDYWYKVSESVRDENGDTHDVAGVTHDPNNYYLHVQVVKKDDSLARLVTLHKPDPSDQSTWINAKTDGVTNIYGNGKIIIKKVVNGTAADDDHPFNVDVTMSSTAPVSSDITYKFFNKSNVQQGSVVIPHTDWTKSGDTYTLKKTIEITANKRVEFYNVPYGVTYTVQEEDYTSSYKLPTYNIDTEIGVSTEDDTIVGAHSSTWTEKYVKGSISDIEDTITIINTQDATIDVGVIIDNMPYIVIMLFVIGAIVLYAATRHKKEKVD